MRRRSRHATVAVAIAAGVVALVVVGRVERRHWVATQERGMARIQALVGRLDSPTLSGYRVLPAFDCLVYRRGSRFASTTEAASLRRSTAGGRRVASTASAPSRRRPGSASTGPRSTGCS